MPVQYGGSFAPPLGGQEIEAYRKRAALAGGAVGEAMLALCELAEHFQRTPASSAAGQRHPSGRGLMVRLEDTEIQRIGDHVPWDHEIESLRNLFDALPSGPQGAPAKALRDAAFHLLWYAVELSQDREPMTTDRI